MNPDYKDSIVADYTAIEISIAQAMAKFDAICKTVEWPSTHIVDSLTGTTRREPNSQLFATQIPKRKPAVIEVMY